MIRDLGLSACLFSALVYLFLPLVHVPFCCNFSNEGGEKKSDMEISLEQMAFTVNMATKSLLPDLWCFNSLKEGRDTALFILQTQRLGKIFYLDH